MAKQNRKPQKQKRKTKRPHGGSHRKSTNEMIQSLIEQSLSGKPPRINLSTGAMPVDTKGMIDDYRLRLVKQYHVAMKNIPKGSDGTFDRLDVIDMNKVGTFREKESTRLGVSVHALDFDEITNRRIEDYEDAHGWLSVLPCLPEGIVLLDNIRTYFSFDRLSLEDKQIDLHIAVWSQFDKDVYMCHNDIYVTLDFNVKRWYAPLMLFDDKSRNAVQLYGSIPTQYMCKWNATDRANWSDFIDMSKNMLASLKEGYEKLNYKEPTEHPDMYYEVRKFLTYMSIANALMATTNAKPETRRTPAPDNDRAITMGIDHAPNTIVQRFDTGLTVSAKHIVDPLRKNPTLINYTQDQWTVRGHTRTYKDGHTAYIKPHTRTRHGMPDTGNTSQPRKIREITSRGENDE